MSRSRARIALVDLPIDEAIEEHRGGAGEDHAKQHEHDNARRWFAVGRDDERGEREGQREDRVREANEPEKTRDDVLQR